MLTSLKENKPEISMHMTEPVVGKSTVMISPWQPGCKEVLKGDGGKWWLHWIVLMVTKRRPATINALGTLYPSVLPAPGSRHRAPQLVLCPEDATEAFRTFTEPGMRLKQGFTVVR